MLPVDLIVVGKLGGCMRDGFLEYQKRLTPLCRLRVHELREERAPSDAEIARALEREADEMLRRIPQGAYVVGLCVEGETLDSQAFAAMVGECKDKGQPIAFVVGGSNGLGESLKARCDRRVSFGRMTMPHQLFRVVLIEQIYRAFSILQGGKYHK